MDEIILRVEKLKRGHTNCEDAYYSCPLSEDGCADDQWADDECNCGATEQNAEVDAIVVYLKSLPNTP